VGKSNEEVAINRRGRKFDNNCGGREIAQKASPALLAREKRVIRASGSLHMGYCRLVLDDKGGKIHRRRRIAKNAINIGKKRGEIDEKWWEPKVLPVGVAWGERKGGGMGRENSKKEKKRKKPRGEEARGPDRDGSTKEGEINLQKHANRGGVRGDHRVPEGRWHKEDRKRKTAER